MKQIILLRGLAREATHWLDFPDLLQYALGDEYQLHCVDFPGCGNYFQLPSLTSIAAMTEHVRTDISHKNIDSENDAVYVIGISMGGMVALDWAQRFPTELRGLVLINSSAGNQPFWWRLRPRSWPAMLSALFASSRARETRVLKIVSNNSANYAQHINQWLSIQQQRPITRTTILTMLRAAAQFHPQPICAVNGLVLASEHDRMVSVRASEAIAHKFNWPIERHTSAGHDLPMDDPDWLTSQITQWLGRQL